MNEYRDVFLNKYGYYELKKSLNKSERKNVFETEYFQKSMSSYESKYTEEELKYFNNKLEQKELMIQKHLNKEKWSFLDIGCGEGFAIAYFKNKGHEVNGIDFSIWGVKHHNPHMEEYVLQGDVEEIIPRLNEKKYDVINLDSVLDMLVDPHAVLNKIGNVIESNGILVIKVANNYSKLQEYLLEAGKLQDTYWLDKEGHPSYFNKEGLINLLAEYDYDCLEIYGESFIDFNLLNDITNYYENKSVGRACYYAKVELENLLHSISPEKTLEVFKILGEMGMGRELIGIFRKK